jgi:hypothetical protein
MASNAPRKSLPRDEGFRTQENYLADHPEDDFNDLPDQLLRAIRVQCDLENAMELSGLTMVNISVHFYENLPSYCNVCNNLTICTERADASLPSSQYYE